MCLQNISRTLEGANIRGKVPRALQRSEVHQSCPVKLKLLRALRNIHPVFYFSLLKRNLVYCALRPEKPVPPAILIDGEENYEVGEILKSKIK